MRETIATAIIVALLLACVVVGLCALVLGCEGDNIPGTGPTVTTSHPELREPFLRAADIVGDSLQETMLADPALVLDVVLLDGAVFGDGEQQDGVALWGRNRLVLTGKGPRCEDVIALRVPADEVRPSNTSLAHEAAHCALDFLLRFDPGHERPEVWGPGGAVQVANERLREAGL